MKMLVNLSTSSIFLTNIFILKLFKTKEKAKNVYYLFILVS